MKTLLASVSQEIRQPLASVLDNLDKCSLLMRSGEGLSRLQTDALRKALNEALQGAQRLCTVSRSLRHDLDKRA